MSLFDKIQSRKNLWSDVAFGSSNRSSNASTTETEEVKENAPFPPPRSRRTAGWTEEGSKSRDRMKSPERTTIIDSDDDIPAIPDLDDMQDDYAKIVASGPSAAASQVIWYREAETDVLKHRSFSGYEVGMLRYLTESMNSESDVKEEDTPLTWQQLFTEITSQSLSKSDSR
ncbi:intraflagellar transport protein 43 homolog [Ischnura elegans]|uniref:intraflagellar transport protein 43 homolog n=1 Tax=Ischnura elegans TaxID=197161 RepID=UPI001ED8B226|nr:intraflagellar transport protein 43 homolog [Ischnura elegans]